VIGYASNAPVLLLRMGMSVSLAFRRKRSRERRSGIGVLTRTTNLEGLRPILKAYHLSWSGDIWVCVRRKVSGRWLSPFT
jgi:hypothetical protein